MIAHTDASITEAVGARPLLWCSGDAVTGVTSPWPDVTVQWGRGDAPSGAGLRAEPPISAVPHSGDVVPPAIRRTGEGVNGVADPCLPPGGVVLLSRTGEGVSVGVM
jgi:hypothetical protein